jgi:hypothetical protein
MCSGVVDDATASDGMTPLGRVVYVIIVYVLSMMMGDHQIAYLLGVSLYWIVMIATRSSDKKGDAT